MSRRSCERLAVLLSIFAYATSRLKSFNPQSGETGRRSGGTIFRPVSLDTTIGSPAKKLPPNDVLTEANALTSRRHPRPSPQLNRFPISCTHRVSCGEYGMKWLLYTENGYSEREA